MPKLISDYNTKKNFCLSHYGCDTKGYIAQIQHLKEFALTNKLDLYDIYAPNNWALDTDKNILCLIDYGASSI